MSNKDRCYQRVSCSVESWLEGVGICCLCCEEEGSGSRVRDRRELASHAEAREKESVLRGVVHENSQREGMKVFL